jgi:ADP-ribose pyrophosphatase YjhB (NUDIX family)
MKPDKVKPIALCVFRFKGKILVSKGYDSIKNQSFYRPLGGKINFSETSIKTIEREMIEELNLLVDNLKYLGTLENIFTFNGIKGHEIALIYDGEFLQKTVYKKKRLMRYDKRESKSYAQWISLNEFALESECYSDNESIPLYPTGLLELLRTFQ